MYIYNNAWIFVFNIIINYSEIFCFWVNINSKILKFLKIYIFSEEYIHILFVRFVKETIVKEKRYACYQQCTRRRNDDKCLRSTMNKWTFIQRETGCDSYGRMSLMIFKINVRRDRDARLEEFKRRKSDRFISQQQSGKRRSDSVA